MRHPHVFHLFFSFTVRGVLGVTHTPSTVHAACQMDGVCKNVDRAAQPVTRKPVTTRKLLTCK